ncbi:MAG: hypothetical protein SOZ59_06345 [Candidatus Limivivens sp.]|nr:hypothetical protein [Candidatus Limivivens sp.]
MNSHCIRLVKIQLSALVKGRKWSGKEIFVAAAYGILGLFLAGYSFALAYSFGAMQLASVVPAYAMAVTGLITLFFTALKANGILFAYQDYEMLMALPIRTGTIITSRFLTMYLLNLAFTVLVMLPMGVGYCLQVRPGLFFYPIWFLGMVMAPLIPTTIATFLGLLIIWFSSRFRHANLVTTAVSILLFAAFMAFCLFGQMTEHAEITAAQIRDLGEMIAWQIHRIYPPSFLFEQAVNQESPGWLLIFAGISVIWYGIFLKLISWKYVELNTALTTSHTKGNYQVTELREASPVKAICIKELRRFFGCPIYTLNMGMGVVMAVLFAGACLVMGLDKMETVLGIPGMGQKFAVFSPFILAGLLGMTCTTCVSLSLEGKNLWILRSLPLAPEKIYRGKIAMNLLLTIPASLLCSLLLAAVVQGNVIQMVLLFLVPAVYSLFHSVLGMWINLKFPNYQWTTETAVVKQSMASLCGILLGMLNVVPPVLLTVFLPEDFQMLPGVVFVVLWAAGAAGIWHFIKKQKFW